MFERGKGETDINKQGNTNSSKSNTSTNSSETTSAGSAKGESNIKNTQSSLVESPKPEYAPIEIGTESSSEIAKPKRKYKKRKTKKDEEKNSSEDIQKLLEGVFSVISLKAGQHWQLTPAESKQIADPLSNILEKHNLLEKAESMSDGVALIVACVSIVLPRILISKMNKPAKIKEVMKNNGAINTRKTSDKSSESSTSTTTKSRNNAGNSDKGAEPTLGEYVNSLSPQFY